MKIPRSSHGVCYIPPYIYQIGGFTNNQKMTKSVERFNILDNSCEEVCSLNNPASSLCCTSFNASIYKFGGIGDNRQLSPFIEKYEIQGNTWTVIDPKISQFENA